jgi:hypothetical protein
VVWAVSRMVPQPLATFTQPVQLRSPPSALPPRTFILCTEGKEGEPPRQYESRVRADPDWRLVELAASHSAHVTAPRDVAAALRDVVLTGLPVPRSPAGEAEEPARR